MRKLMKALFLAASGFEDLELFYPLYRLREAGVECVIAASSEKEMEGKRGYKAVPDITFAEAKSKEYSLLMIPGGKSPESVRLESKALDITQFFFETGLPVAAICHGIQVLISAGVLMGRKATCHAGIRDDLRAAGGIYEDSEVVVDGNLITSRVPSDLPAFMVAVMARLRI